MPIYEKLQNAGLPVLSASETGEISMAPLTTLQEKLYHNILLEHFQPSKWAEIVQNRSDIQTIKETFQAVIARLEQIETAVNPTNAQIIQAIKDMAKYERLILKVLTRLV